jgi:hypothetical protein
VNNGVPLITFAAVAQQVADHGWRPFPGLQSSKRPAMHGWSELNRYAWDQTDLVAAITDYQPADNYACCLAVQPEIVALDFDIVDSENAEYANALADDVFGATPLVRIGYAPKQIRIYRATGHIKSRKLHPLEIFSGTGQFVAYGWHAKAGRPYLWPHASPLTINVDDHAIPAVTPAQIERFTTKIFRTVPRRLIPTRQIRPGGVPQTVGQHLRMLVAFYGSWKRAAAKVLSEACKGAYNETLWAVVTSAAGRGIPEAVVWELIETHYAKDPNVSAAKITADITCMIERTRARPRQHSPMTFK